MQGNIKMDNFILKNLYEDRRLKIDEIVIVKNRSIFFKNEESSTQYYVVCGCIVVYELGYDLELLGTTCLAPGQLHNIKKKETNCILIESLDSFEYDSKILKIYREEASHAQI
jgi:hypothetical protein